MWQLMIPVHNAEEYLFSLVVCECNVIELAVFEGVFFAIGFDWVPHRKEGPSKVTQSRPKTQRPSFAVRSLQMFPFFLNVPTCFL
jgi:hypothetical protein